MIFFQKAPPTKDNGTTSETHENSEEEDEVIGYKPKRRRTLDLSDSEDDESSTAVRQQTITGNMCGDLRPRGCRFEPHQLHCVVYLSKTH